MELSSRLHWCIIYCTLLVHIDDHVVAYLQLNNLYEVHLGKCQSRIKVLETLAAGATEEIQVSWIKFWIVLLILFEFRFSNWVLSFFFSFICRLCCQSCNKSRCDFVIQYFCSVPFLLLPSFLRLGIFLVPLGKMRHNQHASSVIEVMDMSTSKEGEKKKRNSLNFWHWCWSEYGQEPRVPQL